MSKADKKPIKNQINTQLATQTGQQDQLRNQFQSQYDFYGGADRDLRNQIQSGYQNFDINDLLEKYGGGGRSGSVSGGIDPSHVSDFGAEPYAGYRNFSQGGGLSPEFWQGYNKSMGDFDTAGNSYKNFIDTGGFTPGELQAMRARGESGVSSIYQSGKDSLNRANSIAGGDANTLAARQGKMTRDAAQQIGKIGIENEANIAGMTQQGREFGTTGMQSNASSQMAARQAVAELDSQLKLAGLAGMTDIEKTRLEAEFQNAQLNQNASSANSSRNAGDAQFRAAMEMQRLGGMQDLYSSAPGATGQAGQFQLALQQLAQGGNQDLLNTSIANSNRGGFNFASLLGPIGSGLSRIFGGGPSDSPDKKKAHAELTQDPANNPFLANLQDSLTKGWGGDNQFMPRMGPQPYGR